MRSKRVLFLLAAMLLLLASPIFAQAPGAAAAGLQSGEIRTLGLVIGMGIASGLCGIGQGKAASGAAEAMARNPGAKAGIQFVLILGLVFIESLAIYTLVVVFVKG